MTRYPEAILFDYQGTLVGGSLMQGRSYVQPGVLSALSRLKGRYRLVVVARGLPSEAVRADLRRLALVDFFEFITSTADFPRDVLAHTLQHLNVHPDRALFVGSAEALFALEPHRAGVRSLLYTGESGMVQQFQALLSLPAGPVLSDYTQLPILVFRLTDGSGLAPVQSVPLSTRLGGLLLGFAMGTAAMFYLWQRDSRDMDEYGETIPSQEE